jgi:hypothetical protein
VSSSSYSRHAHSVSAPPQRMVETRALPSRAAAGGKRPRLERKYSKIVDQYRSLDEVCVCVCAIEVVGSYDLLNCSVGSVFVLEDGQIFRYSVVDI